MKRFRVRLHWTVAATVFVDAENEPQARERACATLGEPIRSSLVIDGAEACEPEDTFAYWRHRFSGEVYAIRQRGERVTGCVGPLGEANRRPEALPGYPYDAWRDYAAWARHAAACFDVVETDEGGEER